MEYCGSCHILPHFRFFPVKEPNMEITTPSHPPRRKPRISNFQKQIHWSCLWWLDIGFCAGWVDESLQKWWIHGGCPRLVASFSLVFGHRLGVPFSDWPTAWFLRAISGKPCLQVLHPSMPWGFSMFQPCGLTVAIREGYFFSEL